jgi:hypothetical protein
VGADIDTIPYEQALQCIEYACGNDRYFVVGSGTLEHDEHAPLDVPQGTYRLVTQREWVDEVRNVDD